MRHVDTFLNPKFKLGTKFKYQNAYFVDRELHSMCVYESKRPETEKEAIPILFLILAFRALLRSGSREQDDTVCEISEVIPFQKATK